MAGMTVQLLPVLVAAIVSMIVGALWFSPLLFGKLWMQLSGITNKQLKKVQEQGMGKTYFVAFLSSLVMAYVLSMFLSYSAAATMQSAMVTAFWLWLGFIATTSLAGVLWESKPVKLYLLVVAHSLVSVLIMAAILTLWM